jgi:hypothetical protein
MGALVVVGLAGLTALAVTAATAFHKKGSPEQQILRTLAEEGIAYPAPGWSIHAREVRANTLLRPVLKQRDASGEITCVITAHEADMRLDGDGKALLVRVRNAHRLDQDGTRSWYGCRCIEIPLAEDAR